MEINRPDLWREALPVPEDDGHKYNRGHAVILGAPDLTGATRLAAEACSRMGAGLVTVMASERADIYRTTLPPDIMVTEGALEEIRKPTALLGGPGGVSEAHRKTLYYSRTACPRVLDAGAIPRQLEMGRDKLAGNWVLTPHDGEFARAFPGHDGTREQKAAAAARRCGSIVVLKGARTIVAAPDGKLTANEHASPYLAKAGTGDVLAGMITGLIAQKMPSYEAACAAVWIHGEAGREIGPGLVARDIVNQLPAILHDLLGYKSTPSAP